MPCWVDIPGVGETGSGSETTGRQGTWEGLREQKLWLEYITGKNFLKMKESTKNGDWN